MADEIKSATILEDEPGWMLTPDMPGVLGFKCRVATCTPRSFWHYGGQIPILEILKPEEIAKRYFKVPFYFYNPKTGNTTFIEPTLAQIAYLITKEWVRSRDWAKVIGYEEVA